MAIDPVCGMEVAQQGAQHSLHFDHETVYFCSDQCKESYVRDHRGKVSAKKGFLTRFLEKLAKDNNRTYGGKPPCCH